MTNLIRSILVLFLVTPALVRADDEFHGCGSAGRTKIAAIKAVNRQKNRETILTDDDVDTSVTLKKISPPQAEEVCIKA